MNTKNSTDLLDTSKIDSGKNPKFSSEGEAHKNDHVEHSDYSSNTNETDSSEHSNYSSNTNETDSSEHSDCSSNGNETNSEEYSDYSSNEDETNPEEFSDYSSNGDETNSEEYSDYSSNGHESNSDYSSNGHESNSDYTSNGDESNPEEYSDYTSNGDETNPEEYSDYTSNGDETNPEEDSDYSSNGDETELEEYTDTEEHLENSSDSNGTNSLELDHLNRKEKEKHSDELLEVSKEIQEDNSGSKNSSESKFFKRQSLSTTLGTDIASEFEAVGNFDSSTKILDDALSEDKKSARIIDLFPRVNSARDCITPKGENGTCLSLTQCTLTDTLSNYNTFLQYMCLTRGIFVGICCPDNPVIEITDSVENASLDIVEEFKQPQEGCGLAANTRIVGGTVSVPHEWSWMVALLRRNRFFCGGVIINDWYVLTAAHCILGVRLKDLKVRLGEYNFNEKNLHQEDIPVAEIKRHALFVTLTFQHDIALLKLRRRIEYTKFIGSICLPNPGRGSFSDMNATVVGWGTVSFGGKASPVLRQVTIPVWDNDECDKVYRFERITESFLCAGSPENGEDACQGDSGGPLMTINEEGRWEVIGIVSWGRRCGDPTFPGVYTRVTTYLNWINENMR
ncbi:proclotting enzyme [Trichonephila clavata]|uniref:Proclotting enzyme n=1 Tax=Trichonephila clavata TaxID=2740835 RepID=A0A8X6FLB9_TRICU|nr:proclotting enzyme [Trichonephila clavata]